MAQLRGAFAKVPRDIAGTRHTNHREFSLERRPRAEAESDRCESGQKGIPWYRNWQPYRPYRQWDLRLLGALPVRCGRSLSGALRDESEFSFCNNRDASYP